ncbi:MAG: c-type cytochrome, partial [Akkermansiaceae bacterium]|nr:c-type cytochrome [Akkermansiaceae bacterium]
LIKSRIEGFAKAKPSTTRGHTVFQTHCAACHQVAGQGGFLGPQLDGIGKRGVSRLCEDILDPNRNVDAHFYLTTLKLVDGTNTAGFIRGESGAVLDLVDAAGRNPAPDRQKLRRFQGNERSLVHASHLRQDPRPIGIQRPAGVAVEAMRAGPISR